MLFPSHFLDQLRARISLADVVGRRVKLVKRGREYIGLCPFHKEKTPSFHVVEDKGFYHCFGCGAHGDIIGFTMQTGNLSFPEAVEILARRARMTVPTSTEVVMPKLSLPAPADPDAPLVRRKLEAILATATRLLVRQDDVTAASILANAEVDLVLWEHDNWNGGQDTWRLTLAVPADVYFELEGREALQNAIDRALRVSVEAISDSDFMQCRIVTALQEDPDWREKTRQALSGEGITNQGRVHSNNIAARKHDGLLFRSIPETHLYDALKRAGIPVAPLATVVQGGINFRRIEPDFVIFRHGMYMIVEVDGDLYHRETPVQAHARLKFLLDEGARLERIGASECDTPEKAKEAVARLIATLEKHRSIK